MVNINKYIKALLVTREAIRLIKLVTKHFIWVRSRKCGCLVTWFCYQLIAKPGNKTAAVSWPHPYEHHPRCFSLVPCHGFDPIGLCMLAIVCIVWISNYGLPKLALISKQTPSLCQNVDCWWCWNCGTCWYLWVGARKTWDACMSLHFIWFLMTEISLVSRTNLHGQNHSCWWPGDGRRQGTRNHNIDLDFTKFVYACYLYYYILLYALYG